MRQIAVVCAAVILKPSGVIRVLVKILRANVVVLTSDHAAQTREIAFDHVGVFAVVAIDFAVVHALDVPARVQQVPVACFVG